MDFFLIGWVWFYGISTIVGYLMPNPVFYIYIKYMICKHIFEDTRSEMIKQFYF